jgi:phage nucleotide-binding protein
MARIAKPEVTSTNLKVLVYSEPGVGKTTFLGTSPNCLVIDVERGARTLMGTSVDVMEYVSIEQIDKMVDYLLNDDPAFAKYDTIAFDSISEMQRRLLDQQLAMSSKKVGAPVYKAGWDEWGVNTQILRAMVSRFRDIPKNLVMTAHAKADKEESTGIMQMRPDLTPRLASTIAGMFDVVGYMKINSKGERIMQVQPSKTVVAKSRIVGLPKEIVNPTWSTLTA